MITFKNILQEYSTDDSSVTVYHGTTMDSWNRKRERGYFRPPIYVTTSFDVAKEFAVYPNGEDGFQRDEYKFIKTHYNDDWSKFVDERNPSHPKGRLQLAYEFYNSYTPVVLELVVDLKDFKKVSEIGTANGAYIDERLPVDVVVDVHELSWEELLKDWGLTPETARNAIVWDHGDSKPFMANAA